MRCGICGGIVGTGEPVVAHGEGVAHRFSTSCDWYKKKLTEYAAAQATEPGGGDEPAVE